MCHLSLQLLTLLILEILITKREPCIKIYLIENPSEIKRKQDFVLLQ